MSFKFSEFLKHELSKKTIRAKDLAKLIDKVPSYITKLQKEDIVPNYKDLRVISKAFGVNYEFLLFQIGIIDTNTLTHINAFGSLKSYLAEIMNLTDMTEDKWKIFNEFVSINIDKLNDELSDELMSETLDFLGDDFQFPNYNNPYSDDPYKGFKKIPNVTFSKLKQSKSDVESKMLPVYHEFQENQKSEPISKFPITVSMLTSKASDITNDFFWYSPMLTVSKDLYLIEKITPTEGDKVLYKDKSHIYTGVYSSTSESIVISNIYDTKKDKLVEGPPLIVSNKENLDIFIIGKVISTLKAA